MSKYDDMLANGCSEYYIQVCKDTDVVINKFRAIQTQYRNGMIGDDEFLAARAEYTQAINSFDSAYESERT